MLNLNGTYNNRPSKAYKTSGTVSMRHQKIVVRRRIRKDISRVETTQAL